LPFGTKRQSSFQSKPIKRKGDGDGDDERFNHHELLIAQNKLTFIQAVLLAKAQYLVQM
jgi:hypothetical protein